MAAAVDFPPGHFMYTQRYLEPLAAIGPPGFGSQRTHTRRAQRRARQRFLEEQVVRQQELIRSYCVAQPPPVRSHSQPPPAEPTDKPNPYSCPVPWSDDEGDVEHARATAEVAAEAANVMGPDDERHDQLQAIVSWEQELEEFIEESISNPFCCKTYESRPFLA